MSRLTEIIKQQSQDLNGDVNVTDYSIDVRLHIYNDTFDVIEGECRVNNISYVGGSDEYGREEMTGGTDFSNFYFQAYKDEDVVPLTKEEVDELEAFIVKFNQ